MALWAFIPGKTITTVLPELPAGATRQDTGQWTTEVEKWSRACGYWDLDKATAADDIADTRQMTMSERIALYAAVAVARGRKDTWQQWMQSRRSAILTAQGQSHDWIDAYGVPWEGSNSAGATWNGIGSVAITGLLNILNINIAVGRVDQKAEILRAGMQELFEAVIYLASMVVPMADRLAEIMERQGENPPPMNP